MFNVNSMILVNIVGFKFSGYIIFCTWHYVDTILQVGNHVQIDN